jgi:hypothetical protein
MVDEMDGANNHRPGDEGTPMRRRDEDAGPGSMQAKRHGHSLCPLMTINKNVDESYIFGNRKGHE